MRELFSMSGVLFLYFVVDKEHFLLRIVLSTYLSVFSLVLLRQQIFAVSPLPASSSSQKIVDIIKGQRGLVPRFDY